ncbi:MAG TPA: pilus assembly protein PilM [Candidatus Paceibacterota bacterium]|nr:pilus assembly protein PilM [Candidatus Paceibacterota bacterium]
MPLAFGELARAAFAPPRYLSPPLAGIDLSTSGVKAVSLTEGRHGLMLTDYAEEWLPSGAFTDGEIVDRAAVVHMLAAAAKKAGITSANVALPESKSYLFESTASGMKKSQWCTEVEQHLDEMVPLPPQETAFDVVDVGQADDGQIRLAGVGFARRIVNDTLAAFDEAGIQVRALEGETFAIARALLLPGDDSTILIVDVGKTTTKLSIVSKHIPRFTTTIGIGGHALTLAVQKHFGVTENEARRVKAERGIVPAPGNEDYLAAMLSTVSAIRDEISHRLDYWQGKAAHASAHEPVSRAVLVGGNASVRGFPEYLEGSLHIPVATGDVFTNLASRDYWMPSLDYNESLAYATAIGLALRDRRTLHA